jgi:superfamily II DNA or RNA helicase
LDAAFEPHRAALTVPLAEKGGFAANVRWRRPQQQRVLRMYSETPTKFIVPYAYGLCRWGMPALSLRTEGVPICDDAEMSTEPRPYQEEVIDAVYAQICGADPTKLQSVIVKAGCGWGKTFFAILLAIDRRRGIRRKAIFTVSQDAHRVQLQRAIAKYTRGVRVGLVQGKQFDVADKDIIIAMVDTLTMTVPGGRGPGGSRYTAEHFGDCGLWVADEAHHIESECFSRLHQLLRPRVTVCLTATPERGDGSTPALFNNLGPVVVERGNAYDGPREAHMVYYTDPNHDPLQQPQKSMALSFVAADKQRTRSCARLMLIHYLRPEPLPVKRKILVLSARICLLDDLAAVLAASMLRALPALAPGETRTTQRSRNRKVIQIVRMTPGVQLPVVEFSIGYITGKMADDELAASAACNFILASMPKGAEGLDLPEADEVWFMTLQKKTEQPRGRVLRLCESKNTARAVFVIDTHIAYFANMAKGILYNDLALAPIAPEQPWQLFTLQLKVDAERGA